MKHLSKFALGLVLAAFISLPAVGQVFSVSPTPAHSAWSLSSTNLVSALSWLVVPATSQNLGTPTVTAISAGSDLAAAKVQAYYVDAATTANYTNTTVSLPVVQTNGFGNSDVIIIRHVLNDSYEKRITTTFTSSTNLTTTVAPVGAVLPGDIIYHCTTTGAPQILWNVAANTNNINGVGLLAGQRGLPLLMEINGTSAASLYSVTVNWDRQ